jgi:hypothetical protein
LLDTAINIGSGVIPRVCGVVLVSVRPGVREVDLPGLWADIRERVKDVGELGGIEVLGVEVAAIDGLQRGKHRLARDRKVINRSTSYPVDEVYHGSKSGSGTGLDIGAGRVRRRSGEGHCKGQPA